MKKIVALFLIVAMLFNCTACAGKEPPNMEPQVSQMKAVARCMEPWFLVKKCRNVRKRKKFG